MKTKTWSALICLICGTAAGAAPIYEQSFDAGALDWTAFTCIEQPAYPGDSCAPPGLDASTQTSAPQSLHLRTAASCAGNPYEFGASSQLSTTVTVPNGTYRVEYQAKVQHRHYAFCPGGTYGTAGIVGNGVALGYALCGAGQCGTCLSEWTPRSGCFHVTDGTATLTAVNFAYDCGVSDGWFDDVVMTSLPDLAYTFPSDVTVDCAAATDPDSTGRPTVSGGCAPAVAYTDVASGTCPGTIERTWTITDANSSVSQSQLIKLSNGDSDDDGILDNSDACPGTAAGAIVDASGCSCLQRIERACPTERSWPRHGAYVSCVAHAANACRAEGLITGKEHGEIVSAAARR